MPDFSLTQTDIDAFLATKQEDDVIGEQYNSNFCLLSETLDLKYPDYLWSVGSFSASTLAPDFIVIDLTPEIRAIEVTFDLLFLGGLGQEVTKGQWLAAQAVAV